MANFVTAEEAVSKIADGAVIATSGFVSPAALFLPICFV